MYQNILFQNVVPNLHTRKIKAINSPANTKVILFLKVGNLSFKFFFFEKLT